MARFDYIDTPLSGLRRVQRKLLEDARGHFSRFFCVEEFKAAGLNPNITQINHSYSKRAGTLRGMHFQLPPHAECKYVSCVRGRIFDVAIDLRKDSPTFLNWHGEMLSAVNQRGLFIPEGYAHGFQTMEDDCELLYLVSSAYQPIFERAINALDPRLKIKWPLPIAEISEKDQNQPMLSPEFSGVEMNAADQIIQYL